MPDKKVIIFILLVGSALVSIIYGIMTPSKVMQEIKAQSKKEQAEHPASSETKAGSGEVSSGEFSPLLPPSTGIKRRPARSLAKEWGRNPFLRQDALELRGILWDDQNPKAVIDEDIVAVGDLVNGSLVVEIRKDGVVLYDGSSDFELKLNEP